MMRDKKGSHVGVVISFMIFILFLAFTYIVLGPLIKKSESKEAPLSFLEKEIKERIYGNLTSVTIVISESYSPSGNCMNIAHISEVPGQNALVKNADKEIINSENTSSYLQIARTGDFFLKAYYSDGEFEEHRIISPNCDTLTQDQDYFIKNSKKEKYIFEEKVLSLINDFDSFEDNVSNSINEEFDIGFIFHNGTEIWAQNKNVTKSIYVEEVPVTYVDKKANLQTGFIGVKVWG